MDIQPTYLTLIKLLENRLFRIPRYQRTYSWQKKQRSDMFEDIKALKDNKKSNYHFMATVVGLRRKTKTILTDEYKEIEIVDGQQRLTTLVILLKAIERKLNRELTAESKLASDLQELLVKQDKLSLILLQTNHDTNNYFVNYIREGKYPAVKDGKTIADKELLGAIHQCENFVNDWENKVELLAIIKNKLTFIFHEIDNEAAVYTVFEVLNNRGLRVSWTDRLKSMLMSIAFENSQGNRKEHIEELHQIWGTIYEIIGLRQGLNSEALKFAATLWSPKKISKPLGEEASVNSLIEKCDNKVSQAIQTSYWLQAVTSAVDKFYKSTGRSKAAATKISHARLLAISIILKKFPDEDEREILDLWEKTSFRIFGLCGKDARTAIGDYVRLAWEIQNQEINLKGIKEKITKISEGKEHDIEWAITQLKDENCYEGWEEELRYLLFRYEEYLANQKGQKFSNEQWSRIWEASASQSIEHIFPQSQGSIERVSSGESGIFVHRLGNLMLLPPNLNSKLQDQKPEEKTDSYTKTGLLCAIEVADIITKEGWGPIQVEERENKILNWIKSTWA